jgi:serine/threonine protein kinase
MFKLKDSKQLHLVLFIGSDENNQLQLISKLCGDIDWPGINQLKSYDELKPFLKIDPLFKGPMIDYKDCIRNSLAIVFINRLLTLNPKKRINVDDAISSPFLESQSPSALKLLFSGLNSKKRVQYEDNNQQARKKKLPPG